MGAASILLYNLGRWYFYVYLTNLWFTFFWNIWQSFIGKKLTYLINSLKTLLPTQSNVVCCLLGDIIDAGKPNSYSLAESLLKCINRISKIVIFLSTVMLNTNMTFGQLLKAPLKIRLSLLVKSWKTGLRQKHI